MSTGYARIDDISPTEADRLSIHGISKNDIGTWAHGLMHDDPTNAGHVCVEGRPVVAIGGGDIKLFFVDTVAVRQLAEYLIVVAHTIDAKGA
jgi:hypothetical protein